MVFNIQTCMALIVIVSLAKNVLSMSGEGYNLNSLRDDPLLYEKSNDFTETKGEQKDSVSTGRKMPNECSGGKFSSKCLKIQALSFIEDLSSKDEFSLLPGLSIVKENSTENYTTPEEMAAELARAFPGKPEEKINRYLLYRIRSYLDGHSIKYRLLDTDTAKEALEVASAGAMRASEGRGKGGGGGLGGGSKGGGGLAGLMAAGMMMKGTLAAVGMGALALLAGKALMTALLSLLLSALVGLKGGGGGGSTTYEIITKPVVSHSHSQSHEEHHEHGHGHGHHGYRRAFYDNNQYDNNQYDNNQYDNNQFENNQFDITSKTLETPYSYYESAPIQK